VWNKIAETVGIIAYRLTQGLMLNEKFCRLVCIFVAPIAFFTAVIPGAELIQVYTIHTHMLAALISKLQ